MNHSLTDARSERWTGRHSWPTRSDTGRIGNAHPERPQRFPRVRGRTPGQRARHDGGVDRTRAGAGELRDADRSAREQGIEDTPGVRPTTPPCSASPTGVRLVVKLFTDIACTSTKVPRRDARGRVEQVTASTSEIHSRFWMSAISAAPATDVRRLPSRGRRSTRRARARSHRGSGTSGRRCRGSPARRRRPSSKRSPATKIDTRPSRHVKNSRVPGRCGVPRIDAPGAKSISVISSSGTGSGTSARIVTPRPRDCVATSAADHRRTFARGAASQLVDRTRERIRDFDQHGRATDCRRRIRGSRSSSAERAAALASASCVSARACRRLARLRARCAGDASGLSIASTIRQRAGQRAWRSATAAAYYRHISNTETSGMDDRQAARHRPRADCASRSPAARRDSDSRWCANCMRAAHASRSSRATPARVEQVAARACRAARHRRRRRRQARHPSDRAAGRSAALGGLDVLVNNASSLGPVPLALLADTECEELERALATNVARAVPADEGAARRARGVGARRTRRASCSTSRATPRSTPYPGWGAYGASKAGAAPHDAHLGRGDARRGRALPVDRSRRHGHAAARARGARCRSIDAARTGDRGARTGRRDRRRAAARTRPPPQVRRAHAHGVS